jgi:glycosyltransferase involved in cell wall biosynthesis
MKVLLVGNYANNGQQSMDRFAALMRDGLTAMGHEVRVARPPVLLGRLRRGDIGLAKWIGYVDRFVLYPLLLHRQATWPDVVHICDQANAIYIPYVRGTPHVLTCHDMIAIRAARGEIAESVVGLTGRLYQRWILRNLRKAEFIACVSKQTAEEVQRLLVCSKSRVVAIPNALNYAFAPMTARDASPHLHALDLCSLGPFFLHVGGNEWYKNRAGAIRTFAALLENPVFKSFRLVMVGKPWTADVRSIVHSLRAEDRVLELLKVSNDQLCALYSAAQALLFPSLQEGFGWPIIEAQAAGCPVITTNRPPMTEVSGGAAIFIDPSDPASAARQIAASWPRRGHLRRAGLINAGLYTRGRMMAAYLEAYAVVCAGRASGNST